MTDIEKIRARAAAATPGPWRWFGNIKSGGPYLASRRWGQQYVMGFQRLGMSGAQPTFAYREGPDKSHGTRHLRWEDDGAPRDVRIGSGKELAIYEVAPDATSPDDPRVYRHDVVGFRSPDAEFIAHSRADVDALLAEVDRLTGLLARHGVDPTGRSDVSKLTDGEHLALVDQLTGARR